MRFKSFLLRPETPPEGAPRHRPRNDDPRRRDYFAQAVADAGLELNQPEHTYNTIPAHEATIWAADRGEAAVSKLRHAIFEAYWVHDRNIGSPEVLQAIADEQGLDGAALRQALDSGSYRERVWQEIEEASQYGITGVPTVVAGGYGVVGAQPYGVFEQLMGTLGIPRREEP